MNRHKTRVAAAATLLVTAVAIAASPRPTDYAQGIRVDAYSGRPLAEVVLPDPVYRTVTRADLGDVRVFNADGVAVPHALCATATTSEPIVTRESLPVFDLQAPAVAGSDTTRIEVATAGGTQVRIAEGQSTAGAAAGTQTWAHVIDARGSGDDLRSIEFDWQSPDGASQANVRVEASTDLDQWRTVVNASTLLRVNQGGGQSGQQLQRNVIRLLAQPYDYLRVVRTDGGPALQIAQVIGERVTQPAATEPVWFSATALASTDAREMLFDAERIAPIGYARLVLAQTNSSVHVQIQSRVDLQAPWRSRWSGEVYSIVNGSEHRVSPPAAIDSDHDRYWRVLYAQASDALNPPPTLELGYRPAKLRFLAQGASPFTLAFGSRRADPAPSQQCGSLLSDVSASDLRELVGEASPGRQEALAGDAAFKPLPQKTPVRQWVLWGVLIVGVGLLVTMALSLLKRLQSTET